MILNSNNLQLYGIMYSYMTQVNFKQICGPGSIGNEGVLYIPHISRTGASSLNAVYCLIQNTPVFEGNSGSYPTAGKDIVCIEWIKSRDIIKIVKWLSLSTFIS